MVTWCTLHVQGRHDRQARGDTGKCFGDDGDDEEDVMSSVTKLKVENA